MEQGVGQRRTDSKGLPCQLWWDNSCHAIPWENDQCPICSDQPSPLAQEHWHAAWTIGMLQTLLSGSHHHLNPKNIPNRDSGGKEQLQFLPRPQSTSWILLLSWWFPFRWSSMCCSPGVSLLCRPKKVAVACCLKRNSISLLDNLYNGGAGTLTTFTIWCCRHAKSEVFTSSDCQECLCLGAGQVPGFLTLRWPVLSFVFSFYTTVNLLLFLQMACSPKECPPCPLGQHHEVSSTCG